MNHHYVYVIFRPHGIPCYVGKGSGGRWKAHMDGCRGQNIHLVNIFKVAGGSLPVVKVREGLTNEEANTVEIALIAAIGREVDGGPLVNQTIGGEGTVGYKYTPEQRAALSVARKGRKQNVETIEKRRIAMQGRIVSDQTKAKIAASNTGKKRSPETIERIRFAKAGFRHTDEAKAKISAAGTGRKKSPESIAKFQAARLGHEVSDETRAKLRTANLGKKHTQGAKDKVRAAFLGKKRAPFSDEHLANLRAAVKRREARRVVTVDHQGETSDVSTKPPIVRASAPTVVGSVPYS